MRGGLVAHAAPDFRRIDGLIWIESLCPLEQDLRCFRIQRVRNTTIIDRADGGALRLVEVSDTLGATVVCDHINTIADPLAIAHMIALRFRIAASFKNRLVRTFRQAGSTGDTFISYQQRHDPRLLLTTIETHTVDKSARSRPLWIPGRDRHSSLSLFSKSTERRLFRRPRFP